MLGAMETPTKKKKSYRGVITIAIIFIILFAYSFGSNIMRTGSCSLDLIGKGDPAPIFSLPGVTEKDVTFDPKGKVTVLNFWMTSCGPCRKELPSLMSMNKKLMEKKNFQMVTVACDPEDTEDKLRKQVETLFAHLNVEVPALIDYKQEVSSQYGVFKFPETFIIDKNGIVRAKFAGAREFGNIEYIRMIEEMLSE